MPTNDTSSGELSAKHAKAITHLLTEPTLEKAALAAGVGESTLIRWMKEPAFAEVYRDARREVVNHAVLSLQKGCKDAVTTLLAVANDAEAPASSRVSAARAILDTSIKAVEIDDLGARLEALETLLKEKPNV